MAAADLWLEPGEDPQRAASLNMKAGELDRWEGMKEVQTKPHRCPFKVCANYNTARRCPLQDGWQKSGVADY